MLLKPEMLVRLLKRSALVRLLYATLFEPRKLRWFLLSAWVRVGRALLGRCGINAFTLDNGGNAHVTLPSGLKIAYMNIAAGEVLDGAVYQGNYEPAQWAAMESELPRGGVLLDIGANIGWYSVNAARLLDARVLAFEPGQVAASQLVKNLELNQLGDKVTVFQSVVGVDGAIRRFSEDAVGHALNHVLGAGESTLRSHEVACISIDRILEAHPIERVDFIKCDVEGAELAVLLGGKKTLHTYRPTLLLEVNARWCARQGYSPLEIWRLLQPLGYSYRVLSQSAVPPSAGDFLEDLSWGENVLFRALPPERDSA